MNYLGYAMLLGWPLVAVALMATQRHRHRGVILAYLAGWLFLPLARLKVHGIPDYDKVLATNLGVMLGAALFDIHRLSTFVPRWFDLPMAAWCATPFFASITNGPELGVYDGLSASYEATLMLGIPYFLGRVYFTNVGALRDLGLGVVVAALVYVPLALFEMRMSPQLHKWVYGFQTMPNFERWGWAKFMEYKPLVFMNTSFAVTMLMGSATLIGYWYWRSRIAARMWGVPLVMVVAFLFGVTVMCKVWSGILLMCMGLGLLTVTKVWPVRLFVLGVILLPPAYMMVRTAYPHSGDVVLEFLGKLSARRTQSLGTRFDNEQILWDKAMQKPAFGWGRWGRSRIVNAAGRDVSRTDGMWIIVAGQTGLVGLTAFTCTVLLPLALFVWRFPPRLWSHPYLAPAVPLALLLGLHMIDNLLNAFINPMFMLIAGGIAALEGGRRVQATPPGGVTHRAEPVRESVNSQNHRNHGNRHPTHMRA